MLAGGPGRRPVTQPGSRNWSGKPRAQARQRDLAGGLIVLRAGARPAFALVVAFVGDHRERFGVEPICRVLSEHGIEIAPNSYYAHKKRPASGRSVRDEQVLAEIVRVHTDPAIGRGLCGVRKVHAALVRLGGVDGQPISRRQVERLMRSAGIQGARRGRRFVTTKSDPCVPRPPDLVQRDFTAAEPNRLWVVDYTYVPTWSGMAFTVFVTDVFSRRIVGWRTASSMPTRCREPCWEPTTPHSRVHPWTSVDTRRRSQRCRRTSGCPDTEEVTGSIPVSPTTETAGQRPVPSFREPASDYVWVAITATAGAGAPARCRAPTTG